MKKLLLMSFLLGSTISLSTVFLKKAEFPTYYTPSFAGEAFFYAIKTLNTSHIPIIDALIYELEKKYGPAKDVYVSIFVEKVTVKRGNYMHIYCDRYTPANSTLPEAVSLISAAIKARIPVQDRLRVINILKQYGVVMTPKDISNIRIEDEPVLTKELIK